MGDKLTLLPTTTTGDPAEPSSASLPVSNTQGHRQDLAFQRRREPPIALPDRIPQPPGIPPVVLDERLPEPTRPLPLPKKKEVDALSHILENRTEMPNRRYEAAKLLGETNKGLEQLAVHVRDFTDTDVQKFALMVLASKAKPQFLDSKVADNARGIMKDITLNDTVSGVELRKTAMTAYNASLRSDRIDEFTKLLTDNDIGIKTYAETLIREASSPTKKKP